MIFVHHSYKFCIFIAPEHLVSWIDCWSKTQLLITFPHQRYYNAEMKAPCGIQLAFPLKHCCQFAESNPVFQYQTRLYKHIHLTSWITNQLNATQSFHWNPCLAKTDGKLLLHIAHYQDSSQGPLSQIPKFPLQQVSIPHLKCSLHRIPAISVQFSPCIPSPHTQLFLTPIHTCHQSTARSIQFPCHHELPCMPLSLTIWTGVRQNQKVVFICILLMTKDAETFLKKWFLAIRDSFF